MFVIFFFFAGFCGRWEREGCCYAMAVGKQRENLKVDREKKNKLSIYIATITVQICTVTIATVYIYTFLHLLMWVVLEKIFVNFAQF